MSRKMKFFMASLWITVPAVILMILFELRSKPVDASTPLVTALLIISVWCLPVITIAAGVAANSSADSDVQKHHTTEP